MKQFHQAVKKRNALSNNQIAVIRISGGGSISTMVGTIFLKIVTGVAI